MGLLDAFWREPLWRTKAVSASAEVLEAIGDRTFNAYPLIAHPRRSDEVRAAFQKMVDANYGWMYQSQPSVRAVVDFVSRNVAQLALRCYERTSETARVEDPDHPAMVAMHHPNTRVPGQKFIFDLVRDHLVYGNAFALKLRTKGMLTLELLPAFRTSLVGPSYFTVDAYRVYRTDGSSIDFRPLDVLHWPGASTPDDPRLGLSPLETLRQDLAEDIASQTANVELLKAGLSKPGYVKRPLDAPEWDLEAIDRFREAWTNAVKDAGRKTPVLEEGMEFADFGISPKDAEMLAGRRFTVEEVCRVYGVPKGLVGLIETGTALEDEHQQFYADVLPPICEMLSSYLDLSILEQEFGAADHYFEFDLDEKLQGDERLKALTSASGAPILTRNESRRKLNLPPKDGGDELIVPLNVIEGGKPSPQVMPIQDPNGPAQDGSERNASMNGHSKDALYLLRREQQRRRRDRTAKHFTGSLRGFYGSLEAEVRDKASERDFDLHRWTQKLVAILKALLLAAVAREGEHAAVKLGLTSFDDALVEHYMAQIAEHAAADIVFAINEALDDDPPAEVFARAKDVWATHQGATLATKVNTIAHIEAAKQTPDASNRTKTWVVTSGERSGHPEMDNETRPLLERFSNGKQWPPYEHPNCMCLIDVH